MDAFEEIDKSNAKIHASNAKFGSSYGGLGRPTGRDNRVSAAGTGNAQELGHEI